MGADLYLPDVLQACHEQYGQAARLAWQLSDLVEGEIGPQVAALGTQLKEALMQQARQTGEMDPALFDRGVEIADLAQGELAVATRTLARQLAEEVRQACAPPAPAEGLGFPGPVVLAEDLHALLNGPDEAVLRRGAALIAARLRALPESGVPAQAGQVLRDLLVGAPQGALTLLLEHHLLPALRRLRTGQAASLAHLEEALAPLAPDPAAPTPEDQAAEGSLAHTLAAFRRLATSLGELTETLHRHLEELLEAPTLDGDLLRTHLAAARGRLADLWNEGEALRIQEWSIERLLPLLVRTLPVPDDGLAAPDPASATPLQRAFGGILEQHVLWHVLRRLVTQAAASTEQFLAGDLSAALTELCQLLLQPLRPDERGEQEELVGQEILASAGPLLSLSPGIRFMGGNQMDACYLQHKSAGQQFQRKQIVRAWMQQLLSEPPLAASAQSLLLRFLRLLQGDPLPWARVLAAGLAELLSEGELADHLAVANLSVVLDQVQDLLAENARPRLCVLLAQVQAHLAPASPLVRPAHRLLCLLHHEIGEEVAESLAHLVQEVEGRVDWPAERQHNLGWVLHLAEDLWQAPHPARRTQVVLTALRTACTEATERATPLGDALRTLLAAEWPTEEDEQRRRLCALRACLEDLPKQGPQPPYPDPCMRRDWKLRLLHDLLGAFLAVEGQDQEVPNEPEGGPLLQPVMQTLRRMLVAWRYSPEGYFRDPYTDASIFWIALGGFWPDVMDLTEPVEQPDPAWLAWLPEEQMELGLSWLPPALARTILARLAERELRLPTRAQLARWGPSLRVEDEGPFCLEAWHAYFASRKQALAEFLQQAVARNQPVLCSL